MRFRVGEFILDLDRRVLAGASGPVPVADRALTVLGILARRAGHVVSKDELLAGGWPDVAVGDESLSRAISDLRAVLGDSAADPSYIRTVHRRGYVLVADVDLVDRQPAPPEPRSAAGTRRWTVATVTAGVAVAAVAGLALLGRGDAERRWELQEWEPVELVALPLELFKPAFSPRGGVLVAVGVDKASGEHSLYLVRPRAGSPRRLTRGVDVRGPAPTFSADGNRVYFTLFDAAEPTGRSADVWEVPVLGGSPRRVLERATAVSPSPDGTAMAAARITADGTVIEVHSADGGCRTAAEEGYWPRWSPDGSWIAFSTSDPEGGDGHLWVVRPDGSERRRLTSAAGQQYGLTWTPDGREVVFAAGVAGVSELWSVPVAGGEPLRLTRGPGACNAPSFSPDGREIAFAYTRVLAAVLWAEDAAGPARTVLRESALADVAVSPSGDALAVLEGREGTARVSVLDLRTGERRTVSTLPMLTVRWMPDGRSLVAVGEDPAGDSRWVWAIPIDGTPPRPLLRDRGRWAEAEVSPAGELLAAVREADGHDELVVVGLEGGEPRLLARLESIGSVCWSPDGRRLTFSGGLRPTAVAAGGVWTVALDGGAPVQRTTSGAWPVWTSAGDELLFVDELERAGIWRVPAGGGTPERVRGPIGEVPGAEVLGLDLAPAGQMVVHISSSSTSLYALRPPPAS